MFSSIDRFATLYFIHPLRRVWGFSKPGGLPILMYHSIAEDKVEGVHPYYLTTTTPQVFEQHLQFFSKNDYRVLPLGDTVRRLQQGEELPAKALVITFDDGFADFYTHAYPVLNRYGFPASVFLPTAYIGTTSRNFKDKACLTWNQVRELHRDGVEFGSHSVNHPDLRALSPDELRFELSQSKDSIEHEIGCAIRSFCYPYAFPEQDTGLKTRLRSMLQECGYKYCLTTVLGVAGSKDDTFFLKRLPASSRDDLAFLNAKINGGYDWLHTIQYSSKIAREHFR